MPARPTFPFRLRRMCSVRSGAKRSSQSRTASWVNSIHAAEHLGNVAEPQFVPQSAKDDLENDVCWQLKEIEGGSSPTPAILFRYAAAPVLAVQLVAGRIFAWWSAYRYGHRCQLVAGTCPDRNRPWSTCGRATHRTHTARVRRAFRSLDTSDYFLSGSNLSSQSRSSGQSRGRSTVVLAHFTMSRWAAGTSITWSGAYSICFWSAFCGSFAQLRAATARDSGLRA